MMDKLSIEVFDASGPKIAGATGTGSVSLDLVGCLSEGDVILFSGSRHMLIKLDPCIPEGEVYAPNGSFIYKVPAGEHRLAYDPKAFKSENTVITARAMTEEEISELRPISRNPHDLRGDTDFFPHATANVETRNESCFAARCVIDGFTENTSHGKFPYQSWGIGTREDAYCVIDFGRDIETSSMALTLRADWPHDSWWTQGTVLLSDGFEFTFGLEKKAVPQTIDFGGKHVINSIKLFGLKKAADESPFPALTQWEVFGRDID